MVSIKLSLNIAALVSSILFAYMLGVFVAASPYISEWSEDARTVIAFVVLPGIIFGLSCYVNWSLIKDIQQYLDE